MSQMRICLAEYLNPNTQSSFEVWQEENGDVVPYVDGTPMLNAKVDPLTGGSELSDGKAVVAVQRAVPKAFDKIRTVLLYGDSGVQYGNFFIVLGPLNLVNDGSGTCTVGVVGHGFVSGSRVRIVNSGDPYWSAENVITRIDSSNFTFPLDPRAAATLNETARYPTTGTQLCLICDSRPSRASVFHSLNAKLWHPWEPLANRGCNARPASTMIQDIDRDITMLGQKPDAVWLQCGANDSRVLGLSVPIAAKNAQAVIDAFLDRGISVMYQPWQPNDSRDTAANTAGKNALRFDRLMREYCAARDHVYYMPRIEAMINPASSLGHANTNVMATDGVHDTPISGELCAKACYDVYRLQLPKRIIDLPYSIADSQHDVLNWKNRYQNPLILNLAGGSVSNGTGTVPYKVSISKTAGAPTVTGYGGGANYYFARTIANDGDEFGNNVGARVTFTAASEEQAIDIVGDPTGLVVGDKVRFGVHVKTKLQSGARPKHVALNLLPTQDGVLYQASVTAFGVQYSASNPVLELPYDTDEVLMTPWFTVTGSVSAILARVWIVSILPGVVDVEIGRPAMEVIKAN